MWVRSLGQEGLLEESVAIHSSILVWRVPWREDPCRLQSIGLHRIRRNLNNFAGRQAIAYFINSQMYTLKYFGSVQLLSHIRLFETQWSAACQASLSIINSWSLPKLMFIGSVTPSNHLILCCPLLLPPSIFPSISVFSNESVLCIRWPKYWSFSFSISPSGLISFRIDWFDLFAV